MTKFRKIAIISLAAALLALLVLGSAACVSRASSKFVNLKVIWWGTQVRHEKTLKVLDMYMAKNPKVTIEPIYTSWDGYWEKLATLATGKEFPDVINMTIQNLGAYKEKGLIAEFDGIPEFDQSQIDQAALDIGKIDGKLYAVVLGANVYTLVYNKEILDKAGVAYPSEKTNWEDLKKMSLEIGKKTGVWGLGNMREEIFEQFVRSKGEAEYAKGAKDVGFKEQTAVEFFNLINDFDNNYGMEPRAIANESQSNEENSPYAKGKTAMRFLWSNKIVSVYKTLGKVSYCSIFPGPNNEQAVYVKPGMFFCLSSRTKNKNEAAKFINWFVSDVECNKILDQERGVPVAAKVREGLSGSQDPQTKEIGSFIGKVGRYSKRPMDANFPTADRECKRTLRDIMELVYFDKITPNEAAKKLIAEWRAIITK